VDFHATTNGTLLDEEKVAFIQEHDLQIMVSFDGPREIQNAQRPFADGKGSYDSVVPGIRRLLAVAPKTMGHAVLTGNADPQVVKGALREIGFQEVSILSASRSLFSGRSGSAPERDSEAVLSSMEREVEQWGRLIKKRDVEAIGALKSTSELLVALLNLLHNAKRRHACGAGLGLVGVSCEGGVYLCHRFVGQEKYRLGSVFAPGLDRTRYGKSPLGFVETCKRCFARYYCAGGCKHDNAGSCGTAFSPAEDLCRQRRRELELAAVIAGGLDSADRDFLVEYDIVPPKPCPLDF
ncbi:SPASM domain-containing protein, partial [Elusimicrobiota bacterium]